MANNGTESLRLILDAASQSICPAHGPFKLLTTADVLKHTVEIEWQVDQVMAKGSVIVEAVTGFSLFSIDGALLGYALVNPFEFR